MVASEIRSTNRRSPWPFGTSVPGFAREQGQSGDGGRASMGDAGPQGEEARVLRCLVLVTTLVLALGPSLSLAGFQQDGGLCIVRGTYLGFVEESADSD